MGGNIELTKWNKVYTYAEAKEYTKYRNSQPTTSVLSCRDIRTGATVAFTNK
tara:strand:- start:759 stop:914 length:156 start_codon:yes stop_codon:yes gene_type:complete